MKPLLLPGRSKQKTTENLGSFFIDYGTTGLVTLINERVDELEEDFFFKCKCSSCIDEDADRLKKRAIDQDCSQCNQPLILRKEDKEAVVLCLKCKWKVSNVSYETYKEYRKLLHKIEQTFENWDSLTLKDVWEILQEERNSKIRLHDVVSLPLLNLRDEFLREFSKKYRKNAPVDLTELEHHLTLIEKVLKSYEYHGTTGVWLPVICARTGLILARLGRIGEAIDFYTKSRDYWLRIHDSSFYVVKEIDGQIAALLDKAETSTVSIRKETNTLMNSSKTVPVAA